MKRTKLVNGMVDVSGKEITKRIARARSTVQMSQKAFNAFKRGDAPKGNVLETARVAGIMAAKSTPEIIPMCHQLMLNKVSVAFKVEDQKHQIVTTTEVVYYGQTGVEMEALTAASVSSLTIYDMMKWADKGCVILETKLLHKSGGRTGDFNA